MPDPFCIVTASLYGLLGGNGTDPINPDGQDIIWIGPDGDLYVAGFWLVDCRPFDNPLPGPWFPDPLICPLGPPGTYGPIIITPGGDMYLDLDLDGVADPDELFWDCPPYGSL